MPPVHDEDEGSSAAAAAAVAVAAPAVPDSGHDDLVWKKSAEEMKDPERRRLGRRIFHGQPWQQQLRRGRRWKNGPFGCTGSEGIDRYGGEFS
ncbi:OLC1v1031627C1 [Oldenlandia corymbosa var. corymbosa]|uniref:OLC1v1031627C1 n=1 Tax=Oldenlandia corymbosa var. corymbosa TaxID=529605 RepID=A0AAV1CLT0_OLDCO|nr:OLC1v1031627C1 [Oldenlandia corymbosa var. corymbosa]